MPKTQDADSFDHDVESRRGFVEYASLFVGAIVSLVPLGIGLFSFLDPLFGKRQTPSRYKQTGGNAKPGYIRIAALNALSLGGAPQRFPVIAGQQDGWNYTPDQPIGAVFVQRTDTGIRVFNATCPHAGCSVSCNGESFKCPCHNSSFELDGRKRISNSGRENPSPRDLDPLDVDQGMLAQSDEIWVEFKNFLTGKEERKAKL